MSSPAYSSLFHTPTYTNLKRTHPGNGRTFDPGRAPPLPKLTGDLILQVFTHKSLRRVDTGNPEDYGDNERLIELGKVVLDASVTRALFDKRPMLKAPDMFMQRNYILSDENIDDWVTFYRLKSKVRCHPELRSSMNTPQETRSIFYAYVGGVFAECGPDAVNDWFRRLIGDASDSVALSTVNTTMREPLRNIETPPPKKIRNELTQEASPIFFASQPPSVALRSPPPHVQLVSQRPNPLSPAQPTLPFLPLFNQTATQRRVTVEYPAEFSGPSHAGRWTVRCVVNGIHKGIGSGSSKQVAKEEAARQAYYAMGWT